MIHLNACVAVYSVSSIFT